MGVDISIFRMFLERFFVIRLMKEYKRKATTFIAMKYSKFSEIADILWNMRFDNFLLSLKEGLNKRIGQLSFFFCDQPFLKLYFIDLYNAVRGRAPNNRSSMFSDISFVIRFLEKYKREATTINETRYSEFSEIDDLIWDQKFGLLSLTLKKYLNIWLSEISSGVCFDPFLMAVFINLYNAIEERAGNNRSTMKKLKDQIANQLLLDRDLTDVRKGVNYRIMNVGRVIEDEDWNFLKVLIMYGIIRPKEILTSSLEWTHTHILGGFLIEIKLVDPRNNLNRRALNLYYRLFTIRFDFADAEGKEKILRKCNVLKVLACKDYVLGKNSSDTVLKCVNYYFQVIPDPFVTVREIKDVIGIPETAQSMFDMHGLRNFLISYTRLFPESGVLQPRSLKHLSRCAAREHLCKYGLLPKVVSSLMIPKAIKDYLLVVNPES